MLNVCLGGNRPTRDPVPKSWTFSYPPPLFLDLSKLLQPFLKTQNQKRVLF